MSNHCGTLGTVANQQRAALILPLLYSHRSSFPLLWAEWAEQLTQMGRGKHFIGDFLPPDELEKFMETFKALKVSPGLRPGEADGKGRHPAFLCHGSQCSISQPQGNHTSRGPHSPPK